MSEEYFCVIEFGHPSKTPAAWRDAKYPGMTVCDMHRKEYDEHNPFPFDWHAIEVGATNDDDRTS